MGFLGYAVFFGVVVIIVYLVQRSSYHSGYSDGYRDCNLDKQDKTKE